MSCRVLFGTETEYAVTALNEAGCALSGIVKRIASRAAMRPHLPAAEPGIFLTNGGRFYIDIGNHPEYAAPETVNPWDGVRYALAGDRFVSELVQEVAQADPSIARILLRKGNVDYATAGATWASHENYLSRLAAAALGPRLVSHLVSRIVFTGAGGFDPFDTLRPRFVLSPRALFLRHGMSFSTTSGGRALVDERNQPHCAGFHRQHLMCGDGLCGHLGGLLRLGTTALVIALIEADCEDGQQVSLEDPLGALLTVARDVSLGQTVRLASGRSATALDIQWHYLQGARAHLDVLPEWAAALCEIWEDTLNRLEQGVDAVSDRLDWAIKHALYQDRAARRGFDWSSFVGPPLGPSPSETVSPPATGLRAELCEIDIRFGQIDPPGVFDALDGAGVLRHRVAGIDNVAHAVTVPPVQGRAHVRGTVVTRLSGRSEEWTCGWDGIADQLSKVRLDLSDPFAQTERWQDLLNDPDSAEGLVARIFRLTRTPPWPGPSIQQLVERLCETGAEALRRRIARTAIPLNCRAVELRREGRLREAEWLMRAALAIDIEARSEVHPKIPHRRANLATVLTLQGRLDEAHEQVRLAWQVVGSRYDLTSARVLTMRLALALLDGEPLELFIGQMKTHLAIQPLPDFADVVRRSEMGRVFDALGSRLDVGDVDLLKGIVDVLNTDRSVESLDQDPRWRKAAGQSLDVEWPSHGASQAGTNAKK